MGNKFDFEVARKLEEMTVKAAETLDVQNGQMEKHFGNLQAFIQDSGYDDFAMDMSEADAAIQEVIAQMKAVSQRIHNYAERIRDVM